MMITIDGRFTSSALPHAMLAITDNHHIAAEFIRARTFVRHISVSLACFLLVASITDQTYIWPSRLLREGRPAHRRLFIIMYTQHSTEERLALPLSVALPASSYRCCLSYSQCRRRRSATFEM